MDTLPMNKWKKRDWEDFFLLLASYRDYWEEWPCDTETTTIEAYRLNCEYFKVSKKLN